MSHMFPSLFKQTLLARNPAFLQSSLVFANAGRGIMEKRLRSQADSVHTCQSITMKTCLSATMFSSVERGKNLQPLTCYLVVEQPGA